MHSATTIRDKRINQHPKTSHAGEGWPLQWRRRASVVGVDLVSTRSRGLTPVGLEDSLRRSRGHDPALAHRRHPPAQGRVTCRCLHESPRASVSRLLTVHSCTLRTLQHPARKGPCYGAFRCSSRAGVFPQLSPSRLTCDGNDGFATDCRLVQDPIEPQREALPETSPQARPQP